MPRIEVSISNIIDYIGDKIRPLKEGEAVFRAGHIILCGVDVEQTHVIKSLCLQTSALTQPPHEIKIIPQENALWICQCSCKAGNSGYCKHVIGTLIYINRNEDLDYISCTDLTQKWGKEKKGVEDMYKAKPFSEFCHPLIKKKKVTHHITEAVNKENFDILSVASGNSSIAKFLGRTLEKPMMSMEEAEGSSSNGNILVQIENQSSAEDRLYNSKVLLQAYRASFNWKQNCSTPLYSFSLFCVFLIFSGVHHQLWSQLYI
ncbi:unnamed protein product [Phaedon cochleariae]|uniref:SWIM-type domain-containing protein n=1 Tax=Phaedon cochleariae TaxID=80249 RepID=A0A9N9SE02_PHACE|nr:unnamed protein product [Phaedon cochleariae]